jgi:radical SAM protein with 4Fe4S-binding SPASM domain
MGADIRRLPQVPTAPRAPKALPAQRHLPLADAARAVDRAWRPNYAVWEITLRCDLACHHCGSRAGKARPDELSTAECLDLVDQMADLGVKEVTLIGGEAYLRDDWTEIARHVTARKMTCSMTTGAKGMTLERAQMAKDAGLRTVSVSIDGMRATHDRLRGVNGSFDAALAGLANLRAAGMPVSANTQIGGTSWRELPELLELLIEQKVHSWQLQLTTAMGRVADDPSLLLQPWELLEVMPLLAQLSERATQAKVRFFPGNNVGYFGPHEREIRRLHPLKHMGSCSAGRSTLGIEADGSIKGCPSLPTAEYVGGNVRDARLVDIWERAAPLRFTRERTVEDLWGFCRSCYYAEHCLAGCSWTTHVAFGKPGNNPWCHHRALEMNAAGKRERVERIEAAPGLPFDHGKFAIVVEDVPAELEPGGG